MQAFAEAVILSLVVSAFVASLLFFFYSTAVNGTELPLRLYTQVKRKYREHSRKKRVKERLEEFKTASGSRPSLLVSSLLFSLFLLVVFALLFKLAFFSAVTSDSMRPTFERGDLVAMQKIQTTPKEGDIIMFERPDFLLPFIHRVVAVTEEKGGKRKVRTKGDACERVDPWVLPEGAVEAKAVQLGGRAVVLKDVGNYFILDARERRIGRYGLEYTFMKNIFFILRMYGYAFCVLAIIGYLVLTIREMQTRKRRE
ncbi:MAG: signal peptidase I [Methanophagales archaeon]|nr:signal peptidase I [Methanophagales archaeon]